MSVDRLASSFMRNWINQVQAEKPQSEPIEEDNEIVRLTDEIVGNVILVVIDHKKPLISKYYGGVLGRSTNPRPVWVSCPTKAKEVPAHRVHHYEERLGIEFFPMHPVS